LTKMRMVVLQPSESDPHLLLMRRKSPRFRYWLEPFLESPGEARGVPDESTRTVALDELLPEVPPVPVPVEVPVVVALVVALPVELEPPLAELEDDAPALPPLIVGLLLETPPLAAPAVPPELLPPSPRLALPPDPEPACPAELALALAPAWLPPPADFPPLLPTLALLLSAPALAEDSPTLLAPPLPPP